MTHDDADRRFIWLFLLVAFGWAWAFWVPLALHETGVIALPEALHRRFADSSPAAWGPLIGALLVTALRGGRSGLRALFASLTRVRFSLWWYLAALGLIPAIVGMAQIIAALAGETPAPSETLQNPVSIPLAFA